MYLVPGQFPRKRFLYFSGSASSDCAEYSGQSTRVVSEIFLVFSSPFSQFLIIIFSLFFPELWDLSGNFWSVAPFSVVLTWK